MKKFLALSLFFISVLNFAQVKWMTLEEALKAQETQPKKILIEFFANWCGPCKTMEKNTFGHPVISALINENYYPVKFNAEGNDAFTIFGRSFSNPGFVEGKYKNSIHDFTKFMNVNAIPSLVFLDEQSMPITVLQGALTARELEPYLPFISKDEYKKISTRKEWENYQSKFRSSIKD